MNCSAYTPSGKICDKSAPRFVIHEIVDWQAIISVACEYQFAQFYGLPIEKIKNERPAPNTSDNK